MTGDTHEGHPPRVALVLGATGGIGGETAAALVRYGWRVRGLARDSDAARSKAAVDIDWVRGDAMRRRAVVEAAVGAAVILHAVNPSGYKNWSGTVLPMIDNTIAAARASGARILLPGTIYNYGADAFPVLTESSPQRPTTRKGEIRVEMERRLAVASAHGARALVLRAGDYFGPRPGNSWFSQALVAPGRRVRSVKHPGPTGVGHAWAYLPDVAETFARLADREASLEPFATYHFEGHWDADGSAMTAAISRAVGRPLKVRKFPWGLLRLAAPFNETVRELLEMKPLWHQAVRLDNRKLIALLGEEPRTPLDEAVAASLRGIGAT